MTEEPLAEFVLARIAEDEASARRAIAERDRVMGAESEPETTLYDYPDTPVPTVVVGPERVLAECEAKRQVVELADEATGLDYQVDSEFRVGPRDTIAEPPIGDLILRALALPYADHPSYDEAWRVSPTP